MSRPSSKTVVKRPKKSLQELFSALSTDGSAAAGYLRKKNTGGDWQIRYYELRGEFLMYWRDEAHAKKTGGFFGGGGGGGGGPGVSSPDCAYDLRKMQTAEVVDLMDFEGGNSALVVEEKALRLVSKSGRVVDLRACSARDRRNLPKWQARVAAQIPAEPVAEEVGGDEEENSKDADIAALGGLNSAGGGAGGGAAAIVAEDVAVVMNDEDEDDDGEGLDDGGGLRDSTFGAPLPGEEDDKEEPSPGKGSKGGSYGDAASAAVGELDLDA